MERAILSYPAGMREPALILLPQPVSCSSREQKRLLASWYLIFCSREEVLAWTSAAVIGLSAAAQQAVRCREMPHPGSPLTSHPLLIFPAPRGAVGYKEIQWGGKKSHQALR